MGWETRNGRQYYYSKTWVNGTCRSEYFGTGLAAELSAQLDHLNRGKRELGRLEYQELEAKITKLEKPVNEFCAAVNQIVEAVLLATGHHKPKRVWRKKRMAKKKEITTDAIVDVAKRFHDDKLQKGDLDLVASYLRDKPGAYALFGGALEYHATTLTLQKMSGDDLSAKVLELGIAARLGKMKEDFGYKDSSLVEKMLIDQICLCYARLYWVENIFSQYLGPKTFNSTTLYFEKRLTLSQLRFNRAIETLAKIRRLARRTPEILQVNIAENQVNAVATQATPR